MTRRDRADRSPKSPPGAGGKVLRKGLIIVHTGDGKGKSTAAFGTALRSLGHGYRVAVVQFIKGGWPTGEERAAKKFAGRFKFYPMGGGFTWNRRDTDREVELAARAWKKCAELLMDRTHEVVIFDEINYALQYRFLDAERVLRALKKKPARKHVILTGRGAPRKLLAVADLVTEMKCLKHPYQRGMREQAGIEY